ncbi:MAG: prephenate dehydratase [Rickettsiales bacterium]|nr:prephenate dehydratase [Rickettsiales bacterium]
MNIISFQGLYGAYSDLACRKFYSSYKTLPCTSFEDAFNSVTQNKAKFAMIPVENSIAGRVSDIHFLIENTELKIVAEHFLKVEHHLMCKENSKMLEIKNVYSHIHALSQCKKKIKELKINPKNFIDTAGAAKFVASSKEISNAAIASELSADIYKLKILKKNMEDKKNNTTRFLVFSREYGKISKDEKVITTLIFNTKNLPASLYKALGGFATNGINLTRLESFFVNESFEKTSFLIDVECHPKKKAFVNALKELEHYSSKVKIVGFYKASSYRI